MMSLYDTSERKLFTHEHHTDHSVQRQEQLEDKPVCENANVMSAESSPAQRARPTISPYGNTCPPSLQANSKSQPTVERKAACKSLNFAEVEHEHMGGDLILDIDDEPLAIHPDLMDTEPSIATSDEARMTTQSFVQTMENVPLGDKTSPVDIDLVKKEPKDAEPSMVTDDTPRVLFESMTSSDKEEDRGQMPQKEANSATETPSPDQPGKKHSGSPSKQLKRRPKTNYTKSEKDLFNKIYNKCQYLKQVEKEYLADFVEKHQDQIGGWFTNKRNRDKDKQRHRRPDHSFLYDTKLRPEFLACFEDISTGASASTIKENHLPMESSANEAQSHIQQIIASCMSKILDNVESAVPCHSISTEQQTQNEGTYIDMDDKPQVIHSELMDTEPSTATNDGARMTNQSPFAQTMENVPLGDKTLPVNLDLVKKEIMDAEPSLVTDDTPRVLFESVKNEPSDKEEDRGQMSQKQENSVTEARSLAQPGKKHSGSSSKQLKRRPKTNYTKTEKDLFNKIYNKCQYLNQVEKEYLAKHVEKHQDQIGGWFTNKRNRDKDKQRHLRPDHSFLHDTKPRPEFLACFEDISTGVSTSTIKENHLPMESSANEAQSETQQIIASCMSKILDNVESAVPCHSISTAQQTQNEETYIDMDDKPHVIHSELMDTEPSTATSNEARMTNKSPFAQTMENVPLGDKTLPVDLDLVKKEPKDAEPSLVTDDTPRVLFKSVKKEHSDKEEDRGQMSQKQENSVTEAPSLAQPCHSISTEQQTRNEETSPVNLDFVKKELLGSKPSMATDDAPTVQHEPVKDELVGVASSMDTDDDPLKNESIENERVILKPEIVEKDPVGDITMCSAPKRRKNDWFKIKLIEKKRKRSVISDSENDDFIDMDKLSDEEMDEIQSETSKPMHCDTSPQKPTKRRRKNFTEREKDLLNRIYNNFHYLKTAETKHLAELMGEHHDKVKTWFKTKRHQNKANITTPPNREFYKDAVIRKEFLSLLSAIEILESAIKVASSPANELTTSAESHQDSEVQTISLLSSEGAENQQSEMATESSSSFDGAANCQEDGLQAESSPSFDGAANYQEGGAQTESSPSFDGAANSQEGGVQTESSPSFDGAANYQEGGAQTESLPSFDGAANYQEDGPQTESLPSFDGAANYQEGGAQTESSLSFDGAENYQEGGVHAEFSNYQEGGAQIESSPSFDGAANYQEGGAQTESSPSFDGAANYQEGGVQAESSPSFDGAANYQEGGAQAASSPSLDNV